MKIGGLTKLTLLDYPGKLACIIFINGCNFRCPFCHNSPLIKDNEDEITEEYVLEYLKKRKKVLDGVSISGGEPLLHNEIKDLIIKVRDIGYSIKVDTNGSNPKLLNELLKENLVDYVAMDIKNEFSKYDLTSGVKVNIDNIKESIKLLENSDIDYEFRTTLTKELHNIDDIESILSYISPKSKYYIQNYVENDGVLIKGMHGFSKEELENMKTKLEKKHNNITFRDL